MKKLIFLVMGLMVLNTSIAAYASGLCRLNDVHCAYTVGNLPNADGHWIEMLLNGQSVGTMCINDSTIFDLTQQTGAILGVGPQTLEFLQCGDSNCTTVINPTKPFTDKFTIVNTDGIYSSTPGTFSFQLLDEGPTCTPSLQHIPLK